MITRSSTNMYVPNNTEINDWFTIEQIDDTTYAISEYGHWEETHCYLLLGGDRALLIDTGLGVANIREVVNTLTSLPVLVVTTHVHWDHIGGHRYFKEIAVHDTEKSWLSDTFPLPLDVVKRNLIRKPCAFPDGFRADQYQIFHGYPTTILRDNDIITIGRRNLRVIHTPGHSPGHCCFYEPERKYLYSGDLLYRGTLDAFYPTTDPVQFFQSVLKIRTLDVQRILPGHHSLDVTPDIIAQTEAAFRELDTAGKLHHGSGCYDFGNFQIHL